MKYYHIIYNSSEKPMEGGVGFGIRTATEGTPNSLLKAIKESNLFTDDWETYEKKPTPAQMKENPSSIESVPKNYAVTSLIDNLGNTFYIIARRAYVGFDYGFYKNGLPTRPGNYVIDYYAFDQTPQSEAYEILYEKALEDSNHFIPKSVQPVESNEEMREISLGTQSPLPVTEKPFTASKEDSLDPDTIKLFFHYFMAKNARKKLVVRTSPENALKLTADLYRLLTPEAAKDVRTYINLRSPGTNENFDIFFIHEDYPYQVYEGLYKYVEIESAPMPEIEEAKTFGNDLINYVANSFDANKSDIDDTLKWILLPEYQTVKRLGKITNDSFFIYCIQPGNFFYDNLMDSSGKNLNDEFLNILRDYISKSPQRAERLNLIIAETLNEATAENILTRISQYNHLQDIGFNLDQVTTEVKGHVCSTLLSNIDLFKRALDTIGYPKQEKLFVKSIFEQHAQYVESDLLDPYMLKLYKWFLTEIECQKKDDMLFSRFFKRDMDSQIFLPIIDDVYGADTEKKTKFFRNILLNGHKPFKTVWPYLEHYLDKSNSTPDFLQEFDSKISDSDFTPLFYYSIVKNKPLFGNVDGILRLTKALEKNPHLKTLIANNYDNDRLYDSFYSNIKHNLTKTDPQSALDLINNCVLKFLPGVKDTNMSTLADYLTLITTHNLHYIDNLNGAQLNRLLTEIIDQDNVELFHSIIPWLRKDVRKDEIDPVLIAKQYRQYNPKAKTIDLANALFDPNDGIKMLAAISVETDKLSFKDAQFLCEELALNNKLTDQFLSTCYPKQFKAWILRQKIKRFALSVKELLTPKKKPEPKTTSKYTKK